MDRPKCISRLVDQNFGMEITPQDVLLPFFNIYGANYFRPWKLYNESSTKDHGSTIEDTKENFKITLDIQHFRPHEINVKVVNNEVIIEGNHEERQDDHGYISRQFIRRYCMHKDCSSETVTGTLSSDGVLTIVADKIGKDIKVKEIIVPITMCESSSKKEEIITASETKQNSMSDTNNEIEFDKQQSELTLKDHCRLLKPESFKDVISGTDKLLSESREETDELLKLISSEKSEQAKIRVTEKLEDALGQCKTAIAELTDKFDETSVASSQMSSMKSGMMSESFESQESSSSMSKSSVASCTKAASEKTSEFSEVICAQLKEAADII